MWYRSCALRLFYKTNYVCLRNFASRAYKQTLNKPKFRFSTKDLRTATAARREIKIQEAYKFSSLYSWQQHDPGRKRDFILHDGPPYANGKPHVGHALNKILKDITNRYKLLRGFRVHYIPGWDCHGLPIEQKALTELKLDHKDLEPMDIRQKAHKCAANAIETQRKAFQRWGVMADWSDSGCYFTSDPQYEADQLEVFFQMYQKGLIYQDYMPVHWSPSSRTALGEAELEYNKEHISTAVHVAFRLKQIPPSIHAQLKGNKEVYGVIWTTTPWTLPANQAVCYGNKTMYSLVQGTGSKRVYLLSTDCLEEMSKNLMSELQVISSFPGSALDGVSYLQPITKVEHKFLPWHLVIPERGTGLVHIAPAHGREDFQVAKQHGLPVLQCLVDDNGCFIEDAGSQLTGQSVLSQANNIVLEMLGDNVLHQTPYQHSYPYDWRTHKPVIFRACNQWFVDMTSIREQAEEALDQVKVTPYQRMFEMKTHLNGRQYWCISRQRAWGLPIPVFYEASTKRPLITRESIKHIKTLVAEHGSDCWWTLPPDQLLPKHVIKQSGFDPECKFEQGTEVLDIWFDSGSTWAAVLKGQKADMYVEGLDQTGGWFQSSLITSVAVRNDAPYKSLLVHGFVMDEEGRKMSKSAGNVVDPHVVICGGLDKEKEPVYGADVLRWWAAQAHLDMIVNIGSVILNRCQRHVYQVRMSLNFLHGNLFDFDPKQDALPYWDLLPQDKYMLHILHEFCTQVTSAYEDFRYNQVVDLLDEFVNKHESLYHSRISKDRLFCSLPKSEARRSGQTVEWFMANALLKAVAPITPHLAEEFYALSPFTQDQDSIFKTSWFCPIAEWHNPGIATTFHVVQTVQTAFYNSIGHSDTSSQNPVQYDLLISTQGEALRQLQMLQVDDSSSFSPLCEVLGCSTTSIMEHHGEWSETDDCQTVETKFSFTNPDGTTQEEPLHLVIIPARKFACERCKRNIADQKENLCTRCSDVIYAQN